MKLVLIMFLFLGFHQLIAQEHERKKADAWYEKKNYALAIPYYEKALQLKPALSVKTKLAYCYKMTNQIDKANLLYESIVQDPKARDICYLYYAEGLMSKAQYVEAKKWFAEYSKLHPEDNTVAMILKSIDEIQNIATYFDSVSIQLLAFNSPADDNAAVSWNGSLVFSSDRPQGISLFKETSGATGRDFINLYITKPNNDSSWTIPQKLSSKLTAPGRNIAFGSFSPNAGKMVFTRNSSTPDKKGTYNLMLFESELKGDQIGSAKKIGFCSEEFNYMHPALSINGDSLFFASDKPGGSGNTDIYLSVLKNDEWSKPVNMGTAINTSASEGFPFIDHTGRLYFCSKGLSGFGGFDVFTSRKDSNGIWEKPVNMGFPINSPYDDLSFSLNKDGNSGFFSSARGSNGDDIYAFKVYAKPDKRDKAWHQKMIWPLSTHGNQLIFDQAILDIVDTLKYSYWQEINIVCHSSSIDSLVDSIAERLSLDWGIQLKQYLLQQHFPEEAILVKGMGNHLPLNRCAPSDKCTDALLLRNKRMLIYWK